MPKKFAFDNPDDALQALAERLTTMGIEKQIDAIDCVGRILGQSITADRDSPAADVSAMDGYAIRLADLQGDRSIPVVGESAAGSAPPELHDGAAIRIFTGAIVPASAEAVIKREDTEELDGAIRLRETALSASVGEHVRRAGENATKDSEVLPAGIEINGAHLATMANFGSYQIDIHRPVRVSILTTGDEVGLFETSPPQPWQLRNSNRFSLHGLLSGRPHLIIQSVAHRLDDRGSLTSSLRDLIENSDAVLLTGGVSMGNYDYVPEVVQEVGGDVVFHGLPLRPGKPILGAATGDGKLIMGLPGNPVSATVGCRRMALPLLSHMGGKANWLPPCPSLSLQEPGDKSLPLHWMRLVQVTEHGKAIAVASQGSGDLVSLGHSDGFVELPPGAVGEGPWPFYRW